MKFFFILFLATFVHAELNETEVHKWMHAVEEILSTVSLGPLKKEFTSSYVSQRTPEFSMKLQTSHFRALVATSIVQTVGPKMVVCIDPSLYSDEAVKTVVEELKERDFDVLWLHKTDECFKSSLLITLRPPAIEGKE